MAVEVYKCDLTGDLLLIMLRHETRMMTLRHTVQPLDGMQDEIFDRDTLQDMNEDKIYLDGGDEDEPDRESLPVVCHFLVSSRHMILASSVFKAMLDGDFKEGLKLHAMGELEISLPDDDPHTFSILLDIIHGHNRNVPRQISLPRLAKLAILVDKYQILERVEIFSDMWIDDIQNGGHGLPVTFGPDILPWLSVSWVFGKENIFQQVTEILEREGDSDMGGESIQELPIPDLIIAELKSSRGTVLKCVFQTITSHVEKYQKQTIICRRPKAYKAVACDAMTLGSFLKGCIEAGIWPTPLDPYQGFTVQSVLNRIAALRISSLCEINQDGMRGYGCSSGGKDAHDLIKTSMLSLKSYAESVLEGLELKDFK